VTMLRRVGAGTARVPYRDLDKPLEERAM
jgi:hypothetical protein